MWNFLKSPGLNSFLTFVSTAFGFTSLTTGWGAVFTIACFSLAILLMIRLIQGRPKTVNPTPPPPDDHPKTALPPYLFYLANRKKQRDKLRYAIAEHEQTISKQRPLVCIVGGEYQESHYEFKERFVNKTLPKLYRWIREENDVKRIHLTMCDCSPKPDELQEKLFNDLIDGLTTTETTKAGVAQFLAEHEQPVILYIDILIEDCQPVNDIIEKGFIEFWRDWPAPQADFLRNQQDKPHYRLLVFMCFRYPDTTRFQFTNPWRKPSRIRKKVTEQLDHLDKQLSQSIYWFQVGTVVLPQLEPIKKEAAIEWLRDDLRDECKKNQITFRDDTLKTIEDKIRQFYEGHSNGIPMEILASQLQKILQESTT